MRSDVDSRQVSSELSLGLISCVHKELQELFGVETLHIWSKKYAVNIKQKNKGFPFIWCLVR